MAGTESKAVVVAAAITALGTLGAGVIANWDKISGFLGPAAEATTEASGQPAPPPESQTARLSRDTPTELFDGELSISLRAIQPRQRYVALQLDRKNWPLCTEGIREGESLTFELRRAVYRLTVTEVHVEDEQAMIVVVPQSTGTHAARHC